MDRSFAHKHGFRSINSMKSSSTTIVQVGDDVRFFVTRLPSGRWLCWDDEPITFEYVADTHERALNAWRGLVMGIGMDKKHRHTWGQFVYKPLRSVRNRKAFYMASMGSRMPIGTPTAYTTDEPVLPDLEWAVLEQVDYSLAAAFFQEVPDDSVSSTQLLPFHDHSWREVISSLAGPDGACYVSNWAWSEGDHERRLPCGYRGRVIRRGKDDTLPAIVEWTDELVNGTDPGDVVQRYNALHNIWSFGTWGYALPKENQEKLKVWAGMEKASISAVEDFFQTITCVWCLAFEVDGILIMSPNLDAASICERIGADKIMPRGTSLAELIDASTNSGTNLP